MEVQLYYGYFLLRHCPKKGITKLREGINIHLVIQQTQVLCQAPGYGLPLWNHSW